MRHYNKIIFYFIIINSICGQTFIDSDPNQLFIIERDQFEKKIPIQSNIFRPVFFLSDSTSFKLKVRSESYFNDNAPNQENMDIRYFTKGYSNFNSLEFSFNSPYFSFLIEPYIQKNKFYNVNTIQRSGTFSVLNDKALEDNLLKPNKPFRNFLFFIHYKGIGIGWHEGNRWWGPGFHSSLQMTNNTKPIPAQVIGTVQEIKVKNFGINAFYTFSKLNNEEGYLSKYLTSINSSITWYGPLILSAGISRNYLSGGLFGEYLWTESDAKKIVFEGIFTSNLVDNEYSIGGHDSWDQTLSAYFSVILPKRQLKIYAEFGMNDNRMFFADFLSQPDHSMATIFGVRDYVPNSNLVWGFEWTNLMISYSSRHRTSSGAGPWYDKKLYNYSTYGGRRWGAHSGSDSDDWFLYAGYLSDNLFIVPALNYERHGIVSQRPAEVKMEFRLDARYKYGDIWLGFYYEKQLEAFLGFPDYFYVDDYNNPIDAVEGNLANSRKTNTLILSITKEINF